MNNDVLRNRELSIGSDRELDNLQLIRNLDTSHSDTEFRKTMDETVNNSYSKGPRTGHWASEFGTVSELLETPGTSQGAEDTPVRKLKSKTVSIHPVEREYSDMYLESNLRTPRYNTHTSYEGMLENLDPQDPFEGDYKPSGKPKINKKSKKDKSPDSSRIPVPEQDIDRPVKHRRSKRKKKKGQDSFESTSTYTIDGNTNLSVKSTDIDKASVKSNGTYTVPVSESGTTTMSAPGTLSKHQSSSKKSKRRSRRSGRRIEKVIYGLLMSKLLM